MKYTTTVYLFTDSKGKRHLRHIAASTKAELNLKRAEVIQEYRNGYTHRAIAFGDLYASWYEAKSDTVSYSTLKDYDTIYNVHLSVFRDTPVDEITPMMIQDLINMNKSKPRTCHKIIIVLNQLFDMAIEYGYCTIKPTRRIITPKCVSKEKRALTRSERDIIAALLSNTSNGPDSFTDKEKLYITLLYYYGLRKEEALALQYKDISNGKIVIKKAVCFQSNRSVIKETKSRAGNRTLLVYDYQSDYFSKLSKSAKAENYLFTINDKKRSSSQMQNGNTKMRNESYRMTSVSFRNMFKSILAKMDKEAEVLDLPCPTGLTSHVFRHNYATSLYYANIRIKDAQAMLGDSSLSVVMNVYTHLDMEDTQPQEQIGKYLNSQGKK
jgi:integrase